MRKIIHIDMDAFYASVEQRDNPKLKGKAVIVGGDPKSRGVVTTGSYEARKFGVRSAMSCARAYQLCPHAIFIKPDLAKYKKVSQQIRIIFKSYTDLVEPLSLDEAFLDVTQNKRNISSATILAKMIIKDIFTLTGLTASAGISTNKFLAKIASDMDKPNGITVIPPDEVVPFIEKLEIRKFFGVGKATEEKMRNLAIFTGADLKSMTLEELNRHFGKNGEFYYNISRGIDNRPVNPNRERHSVGTEKTFAKDVYSLEEATDLLMQMSEKTSKELQKLGFKGKTIVLKAKYFDFKTVTRSVTLKEATDDADIIKEQVKQLIPKTDIGETAVRLLGVTLANLEEQETNHTSDV